MSCSIKYLIVTVYQMFKDVILREITLEYINPKGGY